MKRTLFYIGAVVLLAGIAWGQEKDRGNTTIDSGTRLEGQLQSTVDVKKARVGDEVVLKTTKSIKQEGKTVVPKGTKLFGRVTEVVQRSKQNGESRLGLIFERIEGKDLSAPINASIVSITNVAASSALSSDAANADLFGSSSATTRTNASSGGGLLGGVTGTAGGLLNTTAQTATGITSTVGNTATGSIGTIGSTLKGVQLSNSAGMSAGSATTLLSTDRNVRLEKGVAVQLQLNSSVSGH